MAPKAAVSVTRHLSTVIDAQGATGDAAEACRDRSGGKPPSPPAPLPKGEGRWAVRSAASSGLSATAG